MEWMSTEVMLVDPFSRVPLGASPPGAGAAGDLVVLEAVPVDPRGQLPPAEVYAPGPDAKLIAAAGPLQYL